MAAHDPNVSFAHFFDYMVQTRRRLLAWIADAPSDVYARSFAFGLGSIRATLIHIADIEWGYVQRLTGRDYVRAESPFTSDRCTTLAVFTTAWERQEPLTRRTLADIGDPSRPVEWVSRNFVPPQRTRTTRGGIAGQLLFHEIHHRAQVMAMLRLVGIPAQDLDYSRLVWERTPMDSRNG